MNKYQEELAQLDRRHHLRVRLLTLLGCTTLVALVLWSAGVSPLSAYRAAKKYFAQWGQSSEPAPSAEPVASPPKTVSSAPAASTVTPVFPGTTSSISAKPQPLYLVATYPGRNARDGTARLGTHPENPQTYRAGAVLVNGAQLVEIYADRVVLERDGRRATLRLAKKDTASRAEGAEQLALVGGTAAAPPAKIQLATDHLTDVIRSMPYYDDQSLVGLQVFPGQKGSIFSQLGLQAKDVLIAINGAPIADAGDALDQLRMLDGGTAMTVTVRRGAGVKEVALDGALIASELAKSQSQPRTDAPPNGPLVP